MEDYKKQQKALLKARAGVVTELVIPKQKYLVVAGKSSPQQEGFQNAIQQLYGTAFTIKFLPKSGYDISGYMQGYPIGAMSASYGDFEKGWDWQMMLPVPDFVTDKVFKKALSELAKKGKPAPDIRLETKEYGTCVQSLNIGPYDKEQPTIALLNDYLAQKGKKPKGHIEIYMNDPRRVTPDKIKTIIRFPY